MNPSKTINRIHFNDLDPHRFEDLCRQLIFPLKQWTQIYHWGRAGNENGVDIRGVYFEDGVKKIWDVQCKRYKSISFKQLSQIISEYLKKNQNIANTYGIIIGGVITRKTHEKIIKYAEEQGLKEIFIWDESYLESLLYGRHPDLLFAYFGISLTQRNLINAARIEHRLNLKRKVEDQIVPYYYDNSLRRKVIIHNINYDSYPSIDDISGISSWFWLEYFRPYFRGISFLMNIVYIKIDLKSGKWELCEYKEEMPDKFLKITAYQIGDIPYDNIISFDMNGDEYYSFPHFYCEFNNLGSPYERIWYEPTEKEKVLKLNPDFSVHFI